MQGMLRILCILGALVMIGAIVWAFGLAPFWPSVAEMMRNPWGVVTVIDLYLGFLVFAIVIARFETNRAIAVAMIAALPLLGNVVSLAWLAWRGLALLRRQP
jgi:energy-converting hydrogenase Eha subunit H